MRKNYPRSKFAYLMSTAYHQLDEHLRQSMNTSSAVGEKEVQHKHKVEMVKDEKSHKTILLQVDKAERDPHGHHGVDRCKDDNCRKQ